MKKTSMYTLTNPIQNSSIDPSERNHTRNKRHPNQKELKLSVSRGHDLTHKKVLKMPPKSG